MPCGRGSSTRPSSVYGCRVPFCCGRWSHLSLPHNNVGYALLRRFGKRIVIGLEEELFLVLHLMIAGRLRWRPADTAVPKRSGLAAFDFTSGCLLLDRVRGARSVHRSILVRGEEALARA